MAKRQYSELKVGLFVLGAIIIVIGTIFWAKGFVIGQGRNALVVYFTDVSGLNEGDPVTVKGVKKGDVKTISLAGDSVRVEFSVDNTVKIKKDYTISVSMTEFTGGKMVYINPGKSTLEIDYKEPLIGTQGGDINTLMTEFTALSGDVRDLLGKFGKNSETLNEVLANVNEIVGDRQIKNDLKSTMANFERTSRNLNSLVAENRLSLGSITNKVGKTVDNVNTLFDETNPELKRTFGEIQVLTGSIDSLVNNLNGIVTDVKDQKTGVGKFIYDDDFYKNINRTLEELEKLSKKIREDGVKINLF